MGGQFEFQNRFAEDQNVRNITENTTDSATKFEFGNKHKRIKALGIQHKDQQNVLITLSMPIKVQRTKV